MKSTRHPLPPYGGTSEISGGESTPSTQPRLAVSGNFKNDPRQFQAISARRA